MASGASVLKGEIHNVVSVLRLSSRWASEERFRREIPLQAETALLYSLKELQELLNDHAEMRDLEAPVYLKPFVDIVESPDAGNVVTGMALGAMQKFLLYGIISMDSLRAFDGVNMIATAACNCQFEETNRDMDEAVLINLLDLTQSCLRSDVGVLLTDDSVWGLFEVCFLISCQERTSTLLRATAFNALANMVLIVFGRTEDFLSMKGYPREASGAELIRGEGVSEPPPSARQRIIKNLSTLADNRVQDVKTCMLALSLTNVALETGGANLSQELAVVEVLRTDLCKILLQNSQTDDLNVLALVLRVIFNLFNSIKEHMKVQLEVFLLSVHVALVESAGSTNEQKELALESLLEFCREPMLMLDLYVNYDCDVNCTNLFETICKALAKTANPNPKRAHGEGSMKRLALASHSAARGHIVANPKQIFGRRHGAASSGAHVSPVRASLVRKTSMNVLNKLAIEGILAVIEAIAKRCRVESDTPVGADVAVSRSAGGNSTEIPSISTLASPMRANRHVSPYDLEDLDSLEGLEWSSSKEDTQWLSNARERTAIILQERKRLKKRVELVKRAFNGRNFQGGESDTEVESSKLPKKEWIELGCDLGVFARTVNRSPREGKERRAMGPSPTSLAMFLKETPGLDKGKIGEYLGRGPPEKYPYQAEVRACYAKLFDFKGMTFHHALRTYLEGFRLPGEAQCIDRLMESFAKQLFDQWSKFPQSEEIERSTPGANGAVYESDVENASTKTSVGENARFPNPFVDADAAFVLSFSTIMLNTDLHNPNLPEQKRMTLEEFKRNNRGINGGSNLPGEFLEDLYYSIQKDEVKVRHDIVSLTDNGVVDTDLFIGAMEQHFSRLQGLKETGAASIFARTSSPMPLASSIDTSTAQGVAGLHEQEMFANVCVRVRESIFELFEESIDDLLVVKCLHGLDSYVRICTYFETRDHFRIVFEQLLCYAERYTTSLMYNPFLCAVHPPSAIGEVLREQLATRDDTYQPDIDKLLPVPNPSLKDWSGAAAHRGLLAAVLALQLLTTLLDNVEDLKFVEGALSQPIRDFIVRWLLNLWWHGILPQQVQRLSRPRSALAAVLQAPPGLKTQAAAFDANPVFNPAVIQQRDHAADRAKRRSTAMEALKSPEVSGGSSGFGFSLGLGLGLGNVFASMFQDLEEDVADEVDNVENILADGPTVLRLALGTARIQNLLTFQPQQLHSEEACEPFLLQAFLRAALEKCQFSLSQYPDGGESYVDDSPQPSHRANAQKRVRPPAEAALLLQWSCGVSGFLEDEYDAFDVLEGGFLREWLAFFKAFFDATSREKYNYVTEGGLFCIERVVCCLLYVLRALARLSVASVVDSQKLFELLDRLRSIPTSVVRRIGPSFALGYLEAFHDLLVYVEAERSDVATSFRDYLLFLLGQVAVAEEGTLVLLEKLFERNYFTTARLTSLLPLVQHLCMKSRTSDTKGGTLALFPRWVALFARTADGNIPSCWDAFVSISTSCLFDEHEDVSRGAFEVLQRLFLESVGDPKCLSSSVTESSDPENTSRPRTLFSGDVSVKHWADRFCQVLTGLPIVPFRTGGNEQESVARVSVEAQLRSISFVSRVFTANVKTLAECDKLAFAWLAVVEFYGTILATTVPNSMTRESAAQLIVNMIVFLTHEGFLKYNRADRVSSEMGFRTWELLDRLAPDVRNEVQVLQGNVELPPPNPNGELQRYPALSGRVEHGLTVSASEVGPPEPLSPHKHSEVSEDSATTASASSRRADARAQALSTLAGSQGPVEASKSHRDDSLVYMTAASRLDVVEESTVTTSEEVQRGESEKATETSPKTGREAVASTKKLPLWREHSLEGDEDGRRTTPNSVQAPRSEILDRGLATPVSRATPASSGLPGVVEGVRSDGNGDENITVTPTGGNIPGSHEVALSGVPDQQVSVEDTSLSRTPSREYGLPCVDGAVGSPSTPAKRRVATPGRSSTPKAQDLSPQNLRKHMRSGKALLV